jgi:hypothetical protein
LRESGTLAVGVGRLRVISNMATQIGEPVMTFVENDTELQALELDETPALVLVGSGDNEGIHFFN